MQYLFKIKKYYLNYFIWFFITIFLTTILSYFNSISANTIKIIKILIPIIIIATNSFKSIKKIKIKGYLNGLLYASLIISTLFLLNIILYRSFHIKQTLFYIIIILTSCLGSMIGNTKKSQLNN